jgi:hypothetical protein
MYQRSRKFFPKGTEYKEKRFGCYGWEFCEVWAVGTMGFCLIRPSIVEESFLRDPPLKSSQTGPETNPEMLAGPLPLTLAHGEIGLYCSGCKMTPPRSWVPIPMTHDCLSLYVFFLFFFLRYGGLNLGSTPWATPPASFVMSVFKMESCELFAQLALNHDPPDLFLLSS